MSRDEQPIIVKKVKKVSHGGHHGGSWKVAYADFVTAMMAFFLVMWLVSVLSVKTKQGVGVYFRSYTMFKGDEAGGGKGISVLPGAAVSLNKEEGDMELVKALREELAVNLGKIIDVNIGDLKDQVLISVTDEGIRIELVEKAGHPMFESGRAEMLPGWSDVIKVLSDGLSSVQEVAIEGHTDSYQYTRENYSNWELSADRANAARRALILNGFDPQRIKKVTSYADVIPLNPNDPYDPINRRVSILIEVSRPEQEVQLNARGQR